MTISKAAAGLLGSNHGDVSNLGHIKNQYLRRKTSTVCFDRKWLFKPLLVEIRRTCYAKFIHRRISMNMKV